VRAVLTVARRLEARTIVMLNADLSSMTSEWLRGLALPVLKDDYGLMLPLYRRYRYDGTLTQALVVPLMRSLFGRQLAHPLAEEFACSGAAADFFLQQPIWDTELGQQGLEFWLPAAAIEQGLTVGQSVLGPRTVAAAAHPPAPLGRTVGRVAGALFALADRTESFWLDVHGSEPVVSFGVPPEPLAGGPPVDPSLMQVGFVQGVRDLLPVWERILAPENLGQVLELSDRPLERFRFSDRLWTRVVYDFVLAYRTRVVYRSHAAQSLAPLYLGRAASVVLETQGRPPLAMLQGAARLGGMFEEEKPYLVDRWR
jgi:glucosylglycerate synthase